MTNTEIIPATHVSIPENLAHLCSRYILEVRWIYWVFLNFSLRYFVLESFIESLGGHYHTKISEKIHDNTVTHCLKSRWTLRKFSQAFQHVLFSYFNWDTDRQPNYRPQQFWAQCPVAHLGNAEHMGSCLALQRFTSTHIPKYKDRILLLIFLSISIDCKKVIFLRHVCRFYASIPE